MKIKKYISLVFCTILIFSLVGCNSNNTKMKGLLVYNVENIDGNTIFSLKDKNGGEFQFKLGSKEKYDLLINTDDSDNKIATRENFEFAKNIKPGNVVNIWLYPNTNEILKMETEYISTEVKTVTLKDTEKKFGALSIFTYDTMFNTKNIYVSEDLVDTLKTSEKGKYSIRYSSDYNLFISTQ